MYLQHFRLTELPFTITPDTAFFMNRSGYRDALNVMKVALDMGEGFLKVTGEVGTGKTLLCRALINNLGDEYVTAYVPNPYLSPESLFLTIADELGIRYMPNIKQHALLKRITWSLLKLRKEGKRVVLCLDEAQAMPIETLETLRLLTNLETEKRKLIQVVLFGQPELDEVLSEPSIRQLRQRITFSYTLAPLSRDAMKRYLDHRLSVAGYTDGDMFDEDALELLYVASRGIPRLVNILAHKAMIVAYGIGDLLVTRKHMRVSIEDTDDARRWQKNSAGARNRIMRWAYGTFGTFALISLLIFGLNSPEVMALIK